MHVTVEGALGEFLEPGFRRLLPSFEGEHLEWARVRLVGKYFMVRYVHVLECDEPVSWMEIAKGLD